MSRCTATTKTGTPCSCKAADGHTHCGNHGGPPTSVRQIRYTQKRQAQLHQKLRHRTARTITLANVLDLPLAEVFKLVASFEYGHCSDLWKTEAINRRVLASRLTNP